jgi:hypothetical protein
MKAPTKQEVRASEEQNKIVAAKRNEERKLAIQNKTETADKINAAQIIEQLTEMFQNKKVSSQKGCSICGIPPEICSDGTLAIINEYLGGEWIAEFENNTGNFCVFEMTNTLRIKPSI